MKSCLKYAKCLAALLLTGGAVLLFSCDEKQPEQTNEDTIISRAMDSVTVVTTENGRKTRIFTTPILEDYEFARVPFTEYKKGIEIIGYDSLEVESSHVVSNYALHWTDRDMWELKGNVVVTGDTGQKLYSQQLTWDVKTKKIYSNVDSKVEDGDDVFIGEGFEADDDFSHWTFRRLTGKVRVDVEPAGSEPATSDSIPANTTPNAAPVNAAPNTAPPQPAEKRTP